MTRQTDEEAIRDLIQQLTDGWNAHSGEAYARPFANDADFVSVLGQRAHGRDLIARGHQEILTTIYRSTRMTHTVQSIRFVRPDVALVDTSFALEASPFGADQSLAGIVAEKRGDQWVIVSLRNMIPFHRTLAGPLDRALAEEAAGE